MSTCYSCWHGSNFAGDWHPWCTRVETKEAFQGGKGCENCKASCLWTFDQWASSYFAQWWIQNHSCSQCSISSTSFVQPGWLFYRSIESNMQKDWLQCWSTTESFVLQWWSCLWEPIGPWHYQEITTCIWLHMWVWCPCAFQRGIMVCYVLLQIFRSGKDSGWDESSYSMYPQTCIPSWPMQPTTWRFVAEGFCRYTPKNLHQVGIHDSGWSCSEEHLVPQGRCRDKVLSLLQQPCFCQVKPWWWWWTFDLQLLGYVPNCIGQWWGTQGNTTKSTGQSSFIEQIWFQVVGTGCGLQLLQVLFAMGCHSFQGIAAFTPFCSWLHAHILCERCVQHNNVSFIGGFASHWWSGHLQNICNLGWSMGIAKERWCVQSIFTKEKRAQQTSWHIQMHSRWRIANWSSHGIVFVIGGYSSCNVYSTTHGFLGNDGHAWSVGCYTTWGDHPNSSEPSCQNLPRGLCGCRLERLHAF